MCCDGDCVVREVQRRNTGTSAQQEVASIGSVSAEVVLF